MSSVNPMTRGVTSQMMLHTSFTTGPMCCHFVMFAKGIHCESVPQKQTCIGTDNGKEPSWSRNANTPKRNDEYGTKEQKGVWTKRQNTFYTCIVVGFSKMFSIYNKENVPCPLSGLVVYLGFPSSFKNNSATDDVLASRMIVLLHISDLEHCCTSMITLSQKRHHGYQWMMTAFWKFQEC